MSSTERRFHSNATGQTGGSSHKKIYAPRASLGAHNFLAERPGFEPGIPLSEYTRLAGERLRPTRPSLRKSSNCFGGGGSRIRTHVPLPGNGFQDRRFRPLSHPSNRISFFIISLIRTSTTFDALTLGHQSRLPDLTNRIKGVRHCTGVRIFFQDDSAVPVAIFLDCI